MGQVNYLLNDKQNKIIFTLFVMTMLTGNTYGEMVSILTMKVQAFLLVTLLTIEMVLF